MVILPHYYYGLDKRQEAPHWSLEVQGAEDKRKALTGFSVDDMIFLCCLLATYTRRGRGGSGLKVESRFGHLRGSGLVLEGGAQKGLTAVQYTAAERRD